MAMEQYSTSVIDRETTASFYVLQEIRQFPRKTENPEVERRSSRLPAQSELQKALSWREPLRVQQPMIRCTLKIA